MADYKHIQVDPEKLIRAIKSKPVLYNKDDPQYYHDKRKKSQHWADICKEVVSNWGVLKPHQRVECCHEIQKRWKSLRTCFGREVAEQHKEALLRQKNLPIRRRKVYGFFKDMSFLLPYYNAGNRTAKIIVEEESMEDETNEDDPLDSDFKTEVVFEPRNDVLDTDTFQEMYNSTNNSDKLIDYAYLKEANKDEEDDDRQFLLSLVPTFKKFDDRQKFEAKIEILKVLKNISFAQGEPSG